VALDPTAFHALLRRVVRLGGREACDDDIAAIFHGMGLVVLPFFCFIFLLIKTRSDAHDFSLVYPSSGLRVTLIFVACVFLARLQPSAAASPCALRTCRPSRNEAPSSGRAPPPRASPLPPQPPRASLPPRLALCR
jgi:hypothetical protein